MSAFDVERIRGLFPITRQRFKVTEAADPRPLIYMDHAASTHPPTPVLDAVREFLECSYANVHRGNHSLSRIASDQFEGVSTRILSFIGGAAGSNVVALSGNTTQALDLAAHVMAGVPGCTLVSLLEHHSNDLPHRRRGRVVHVELTSDGALDCADLEAKLAREKPKLLALTGASNVTGYRPDIHHAATRAHAHGARILVDAAQLLAHAPLDVRPDDDPGHLDFVAGAGHKAYAPFGAGFLFGPRALFDAAPPYVAGGGTVTYVSPTEVLFKASPERHEAGTPNIAGAVAMGRALAFLQEIGMDAVREHERILTEQLLDGLQRLDGVTILGPLGADRRIGVVAFTIAGVRHELAATVLDQEAAIAVRNGCFCAQPYLHRLLGLGDTAALRDRLLRGDETDVPGAIRPSLGLFNTEAEVDELLRMARVLRDRAWKGDYASVDPRSACREL